MFCRKKPKRVEPESLLARFWPAQGASVEVHRDPFGYSVVRANRRIAATLLLADALMEAQRECFKSGASFLTIGYMAPHVSVTIEREYKE